jgi:uncharacterized membrane protein (UPF0127 family)
MRQLGCGAHPARTGVVMELRMYCAYNQTRECFLGLEVTAGDFSYKALGMEGALSLNPNEGLWLTPFRGIPSSGVTAPLDLIYLDRDCCVVDLVESFPVFHNNPSRPIAESLLVLPAHSVASSETQLGDQFVLCVTEEMQRRLELLNGRGSICGATSCADQPPEIPAAPLVPALAVTDDRLGGGHDELKPVQINPAKKRADPLRNWFKRWWSPDARKAPRQPAPRLSAFYWNGGTPNAHDIRDVSSTGLYLLTEDRWYPGTLILMTLQDLDGLENGTKPVISVKVRAVRCGNDGVGLQFVLSEDSFDGETVSEANKQRLERFLQRVNNSA